MTTQVRHALPSPMAILSVNLDDLLALGDAEAAEALNSWMRALKRVEEVYEVSYGQRLVIIRSFEERSLWQYLIDPDTGFTFPNLTAWLSSGFIGCRRVNMDAHRDGQSLSDVPPEKLLDMPKSSIRILKQLSTEVRGQNDVLEAARQGDDALLDKIEAEHPGQHLEARVPMRLTPGRSDRKIIDRWVEWAVAHDLASSPTEAVVKACERALYDAELDEEIKNTPDEVPA